ncbi:MAG: EAL domain-containing protein [Halomonas sp.]|nr:EAL domain-containing protein [Halomonas sp.]MDX5503133.1 EAL domain-containing protein [Halomonas sp.]
MSDSRQDLLDRCRQRVAYLEARLTGLLDSITDGFLMLDRGWRFTYLNQAAERIIGKTEGELLDQVIWDAFPGAQGTRFEEEYRRAMSESVSVAFEAYYNELDLWLEVHAYPSDEGLAIYFQDIGQRKRAENRLRILERSIESSTNGVVIADALAPDQPIVYVTAAFERITGYSRDEVMGRNCRFLQGEQPDPCARQQIRDELEAQRDIHVTLCNYRKDGTPFWNDLHISPVLDEKQDVTHFIGILNDISTQREYESRLAYHADHDALTGLANRSLLERRLQQSCFLPPGHTRRSALLYIDLDDFQSINDSLGHELGDRVLVEVAARLVQQVRRSDTVARLGGDAFVVLLPEPDDVAGVAERLLTTIASPYHFGEHELHFTASIGIAVYDGEGPPARMIQQADLAMYQAKRRGRNTYDWFSLELNTRVSQRVELRSALQRAIDEQQFELHYQPQIHGTSGRIVGCEALIRWRHPQRGFIPPAEFIGLAEDTGQIIAINEWVVRTACRDNRRLNDHDIGKYPIAVNISPMQFHRSGFAEGILKILEEVDLPPALLELELTENILMEGTDKAIETLTTLRRHGIAVAIDDFGTGFSSLSYLKHLPIDKIKIDRSFISEVISDHRDAAIVQGIIAMANQLQLKVVAEGVETQAHYAYLSKHLCDLFQGFYFARPMPFEELLPFLQDHHAATKDLRPDDHGVIAPTILLVDDEPNVLQALKRTLRRDGYHILTAGSARDAFDLLATQEVVLVISDQRMPEMNGTEFLKRVKALYPQTLQILLSGYTDLQTITTAVNEGGIYKFLTKPWDDDELRVIVQQAVREAAIQNARSRRQGRDAPPEGNA